MIRAVPWLSDSGKGITPNGCQQGDQSHVIVTCSSRAFLVQLLHPPSPMPQQSADSDDEFPDDIGQLDLSNVPGLQEIPASASIRPLDDPPSTLIVPAPPLQASTSTLPSEYDCDEYEIDESTIAALDALEARFAHGQPRPGG